MATLAMVSGGLRDVTQFSSYNSISFASTQTRSNAYSIQCTSVTSTITAAFTASTTVYFRVSVYIIMGQIIYVTLGHTSGHVVFKFVHYRGEVTATLNTASGSVIGSATGVQYTVPGWVVLEGKVYIHDTNGTVNARINGTNVLSVTEADTRYSTNPADCNYLMLSIGGASDCFVDDIIIDDAAWPGCGGTQVLVPTGNGSYTNWTNDYANVDDNPPNDDTDYIYTDATVTGTKEAFTYDDLAASVISVSRIGVFSKAKLDATGSGSVKNIILSGGSDRDGTTLALSTSYAWNKSYWDTDPADSNAWSKSKVDALEVGVVSA